MIRRARHEDWEAVRALWREIDELHAQLAPAYFRPTERARNEWRQLLIAPDAAVFVAETTGLPQPPGGLAGAISVRLYDTPPDPAMIPRRRGHVEMLVVGSKYRRRGIGRGLMAEVAIWARTEGAAELVLTVWAGNRDAEAFYERLGYSVLSSVLHAPLNRGS
jgi:ribosomal protein S18 acetylase RimI-like enzyme